MLTDPYTIEVVQRQLPPLDDAQVLVRIEQCGVCTSEIDLWTGKDANKLPTSIGHEIAGVVEEVGTDVRAVRPGERVAAWVDGGGFADRAVVEERFCVGVADGARFPAVAEPLACVVNAVELAAPRLADDVVIIGAGFMGNLLQLVTKLKGPRTITVADIRADARVRAKQLGATHVIDPTSDSLVDVVRSITDGRGADVSYEVTGVNPGLELAGDAARMSGKVCVVGYHQGGHRTLPLGRWNWMAFEIINAHFRDIDTIMTGMRAGMRLVNAGILDASGLVTNNYPLSRISQAFEDATARVDGFVKAVVEPEG
jgi:threonine dehydrogenase-like Zn-dependent dehydrogenase